MKAIVSGHSRGLGAAITEALLARNIPVLGLARAGNASLAQRYPTLLTEVPLDLADTTTLERWLAGDSLAQFSHDTDTLLLINNAGALSPMGALTQQATADIARAVSLNVAAPLMLAAALASLQGNDAGKALRVLHVSSGAARSAYAGWSVYCATKAALDHHARAVALDAQPGLRICSLAPGVIDTDMQGEIRSAPETLFPLKDKFLALKQEGQLTPPAVAASRLVNYLLDARFGTDPVADLRNLP